MAAVHPTAGLLSPSLPSWRRDPNCRSLSLSSSALSGLQGRWQVILSLGEGFDGLGRRSSVTIAINPDGSLRIDRGALRHFGWRRMLPLRRKLCLVWSDASGDECIVGRPARGEALILSRSGKLSNDALFHRVNFLREQGFSLRHIAFPG